MSDMYRSDSPKFGLASTAMRGLTLSIAAGIVGTTVVACAPRMNATHYERWASQDAQRRADNAEEERLEAAATQPGLTPGKTTIVVVPKAVPPPPPPPPAAGDGYNSLSATPPVQTATKSRVMKPAEDDDIY